jgi:hypothetical protein
MRRERSIRLPAICCAGSGRFFHSHRRRAQPGERVTLPSERKQIQLPASTLAKFVGTYQLKTGLRLTITLSGNQLYQQMGMQGKNPLFAESETRFFLKVPDAQVEIPGRRLNRSTDAASKRSRPYGDAPNSFSAASAASV